MGIGNRIYYDENTGKILLITGEIDNGGAERDVNEVIRFIDMPYKAIDYTKQTIVGVNLETKELILETIETVEQKRIRELENALLLQADSELGGIL